MDVNSRSVAFMFLPRAVPIPTTWSESSSAGMARSNSMRVGRWADLRSVSHKLVSQV